MSAATVAGRRRLSPRRAAAGAVRRVSPRQLSPRLKRRLLALAVLCITLAAGYQFWLRDSSLVAVERVDVTGLTSSDAARIRTALTSAGRDMTTLHVDRAALDQVVAGYPVVRKLEIAPDFPHTLRVHVVEYEPAAIAVSDAGDVPVAGDGTILKGVRFEGRLPTIDVDGALGSETLLDQTALGAAAVAGTAPSVLRTRIENIDHRSDDGYVAELRDGPELLLGSATGLRAKWAAAARVLADLEARGATYVDLRIPGRPAVGGLAAPTVEPVAPLGSELSTAADGTTETGAATGAVTGAETGAVTPDVAETAVPNTTSTDTGTVESTPTTGTTTDPTQALPTGSEGGAAVAP
jgi:cell division protein FtsQ